MRMYIKTEAGPVGVARLPAFRIVFECGRRIDLQADKTVALADGFLTCFPLDPSQLIGQRFFSRADCSCVK